MADTAFQPNAFQNNAFQIFDNGAIGGGWIYHRKAKKKAKKLVKKYQEIAKELPDAMAMISAIDPFVSPQNDNEWDRRAKAQYVVDKVPEASRVNWLAMAENVMAVERYLRTTEQLFQQVVQLKQQREEDETMALLLMMMEV